MPSHTFYERQQVTLLPCRSLHEFTLDKFGKLDFLVNNGGGQFPCGAADMTLKVHILRIFNGIYAYSLLGLERGC